MRICITNCKPWMDDVSKALVGLDKDKLRLKRQAVRDVIRRKNKVRRFIPFLKPLPDDHPINLERELDPLDLFFLEKHLTSHNEKELEDIFDALIKLSNGEVESVYLTGEEANLINMYKNAYLRHKEKQ